jgi:hypothetical protein
MGRPKKDIDPELVRRMASIQCTTPEIAAALGVSEDTIERRFAGILKVGREHGKTSLRRHMWKAATEKGNITMMIWLSKNILGMTDRVESNNTHEINAKVTQVGVMSDEEKLKALKKAVTFLENKAAPKIGEP